MYRKPLPTASGANEAVSGGPTTSLTNFFGTPNIPINIDPYDEKDETTWVLPQAFKETDNITIGNTMDLLTFTADSFYTKELLPFSKQNGIKVEWNVTEFSPKLAGVVPERGVGRLIESSRSSGQAVFTRRGIGMLLEHGFMSTAEGRRNYAMNLKQINNTVIETNNFSVINAYLNCDEYNIQWERMNGYHRGKRISEILETDVRHWDILKQEDKGLEILDTYIKDRMFRYRGEADTYVVPPKIMQYVTVVPDARTDYYKAGPNGPKLLQDGVNSFRTFRENRVYETRFYDVDQDGPVDLMRNEAQIGEMHLAHDHNIGGDYTNYKSSWRSIQIYNEDEDRMSTLTLKYLLENSRRHDPYTKKLYRMDDPDVERFETDDYDKKDVLKDFLHYVDSNGNLQKCDYMGQSFLPMQSIFEIAQTAMNGMKNLADCVDNSLHVKWRDGLNAIKLIENIGYSETIDKWFDELIKENALMTNDEEFPQRGGFQPIFREAEFKPNDHGSLNLPKIKPENDQNINQNDQNPLTVPLPFPLPPGYANYPGFKTIADAYDRGEKYVESLGFSYKWFGVVRDFVDIIDNLVNYLKLFFPGSIFVNGDYSSSWWQMPNAETTFFENIVTKHRYPLFLKKANDGEGYSASRIGELRGDNEVIESESQEIKELNKISSPYIKAYSKFDTDYMKGLQIGDPGTVGEAIRRTTANSFVSATLASLKRANAKEFIEEVESLIGTLAILEDSHAKLLVSETNFIKSVVNYVKNNAKYFRQSASKVKSVLTNIQKQLSALKKESLILSGSYSLLNKFKTGNDNNNYHRAPLTGSPALFKGIHKFAKTTNAMPSSPFNPNRPANNVEIGETAMKLKKSRGKDVEPSLKPLHINNDMNVKSIGVAMNSYDNANRDFHQQDLENIGSDYEMERFEASSFGIGRSKALKLNKKAASRYGSREKSLLRSPNEYIDNYDDYYLRKQYSRGSDSILRDARYEESMDYSSKITREFSSGVYDGLAEFDENIHIKFDTPTFKQLFFKTDEEASDLLISAIAKTFLGAPTNYNNFEALIKYNIVFPWNFLVFRPHGRYETLTLIKTKRGSATGNTFMGPSKFTLGDDASTQQHLGFYTYYGASVIKNPKNVFVVRNSFVDGYRGGMGTKPYINEPHKYDPSQNVYGDGSVFVAALPRYEWENVPNPLSITGKFSYFDQEVYDMAENDELHYSTAVYYNKMYGWSESNIGQGGFDFTYMNDRRTSNATVWFGHTLYYIGKDGGFTGIRQGTGHWGPDHTYAGCKAAREGKMKQFRSIDYNNLAQF